MSTQNDDRNRLQALAYDLMSSSWPGLNTYDRDTVVDLLASADYHLALKYLLTSTSDLDDALARAARSELDAVDMAHS